MTQLKISARNAGQVELEKYCPRCCWYLLHLKKMPFQFGMPGVMFYLEQIQKAFIRAHLEKFGGVPKYFGPFADCVQPVEFPFSMCQEHKDSGVLLTAQVDMMFRKKNGNICLLDLKTSKPEGGGKVYLPQYEVQVVGYSWVTEQAKVGKVGTAGLLYCDVQVDQFKEDPLNYKTNTGFQVPFDLKHHEVKLDYSRLTKCLKEVNRIWNLPRAPRGTDGCKDCMLLNRLLDFQQEKDAQDRLLNSYSEGRVEIMTADYYRALARGSGKQIEALLKEDDLQWDQDGGMWFNWEFC